MVEEQSHIQLNPLEKVAIRIGLDHLLCELIDKGYVVGWVLSMGFDRLIGVGQDHLMEND
jgi:hypothetical protein